MAEREDILVLLVEDEPDIMEYEQVLLEAEGFLVVTARDGEHALRMLAVVSPDVIVTDMMMPVMDGFGFMDAYRERFGERASPIVAVSGFPPYLAEAPAHGARATLEKPLVIEELAALIRDVVADRPAPERRAKETVRAAAEAARMRAVLDLRLDEPAPEASIQQLVDTVAAHFGVPIALLSVITSSDQLWSAACGLPGDLKEAGAAPRGQSFCTHAVAAHSALIVQDAASNPLFRRNTLVTEKGIRFYAGVPLLGRHGDALGTLCLLDYEARAFTHFDLELLTIFGRRMMSELEWRERRASPEVPRGAFRYLEYADTELDVFGKIGFVEIVEVAGARAVELGIPMACALLAVPYRRLGGAVEQLRSRHEGGLIGRLGHARLGWIAPGMTADEALEVAREIAGPHGFAESMELRFSYGVRGALRQLEARLGDAGLA